MSIVLLRLASWIVPRRARADWLAEWRAELAYIRSFERARAARFALGAFPDALWLRRDHPRARFLASPVHCLALLAAVALAAAIARPPAPADLIAVRPHAGAKFVTGEQLRALNESGAFASISLDASGRVVAKANGPIGRHIAVPNSNGGRDLFDCVPLAPQNRWPVTFLMLGIAVIVLPTTTVFAVGGHHRSPAGVFLAVKLVLALTAVYQAAHLIAPVMLAHGLLVGFLLAIRWALEDQRRRCPVCLRRVTTPVSFGCLSRTLLDWHGAEFVCPEGHGMLQVSATAASPYAPVQWVRL